MSNGAINRINGQGIKIHRPQIEEPEKLRDICPSKALVLSGEPGSVEDLLSEIEKDVPFYREDGGVTLSGGEPLSQGEELTLLLQALKHKNIRVNIETSLHVDWINVARCVGLTDTFLADLKHMEQDKFYRFTEGDLNLVLGNLQKLTDTGVPVIVRVPVIPGFNHTESEMKQIIDFVSSLRNTEEIHFLPYHTLGMEKYEMLGMEYNMGKNKQVQENELEPYVKYARSKGLRVIVGG